MDSRGHQRGREIGLNSNATEQNPSVSGVRVLCGLVQTS